MYGDAFRERAAARRGGLDGVLAARYPVDRRPPAPPARAKMLIS